MKNYPAIFHLRVCRAKAELENLSSLLNKMDEACQQDADSEYSGISAVDAESLERLEIVSKAVADECHEAKQALQWHKRQ